MDTTKITSSSQITSPNVHAPTTIKSKSLAKKIKPKAQMASANSRSALMLRLAVEKAADEKPSKKVETLAKVKFRSVHFNQTNDVRSSQLQQFIPAPPERNLRNIKKQIVVKEKSLLKELEPGHIDYLPLDAVGSGNYGQCYLARYRGIDDIVKKMIHRDTERDKLRAKHEVVHKAEMLTALGDHEGLPMLIGTTTADELFCLVTQFHGIIEQSVTLHKAANNKNNNNACRMHSFICKDLLRLRARAFKRILAQ